MGIDGSAMSGLWFVALVVAYACMWECFTTSVTIVPRGG